MGKDTTYNGWTNYETWLVALHIDNDEGTYWHVRDELVPQALETFSDEGDHQAYQLGRYLADWVTDTLDEDTTYTNEWTRLLTNDLIGAALAEVNWEEIATNILTEVAEATT